MYFLSMKFRKYRKLEEKQMSTIPSSYKLFYHISLFPAGIFFYVPLCLLYVRILIFQN